MCVPQTDGMSTALILCVARARCGCNIWIVRVPSATVLRMRTCDGIDQKTRGVRRRRIDFASCFRLIPPSLRMAVHVSKHALGEQHVAHFVRREESATTHTNGRSLVIPTCSAASAAQSRYVKPCHCLSRNCRPRTQLRILELSTPPSMTCRIFSDTKATAYAAFAEVYAWKRLLHPGTCRMTSPGQSIASSSLSRSVRVAFGNQSVLGVSMQTCAAATNGSIQPTTSGHDSWRRASFRYHCTVGSPVKSTAKS